MLNFPQVPLRLFIQYRIKKLHRALRFHLVITPNYGLNSHELKNLKNALKTTKRYTQNSPNNSERSVANWSIWLNILRHCRGLIVWCCRCQDSTLRGTTGCSSLYQRHGHAHRDPGLTCWAANGRHQQIPMKYFTNRIRKFLLPAFHLLKDQRRSALLPPRTHHEPADAK